MHRHGRATISAFIGCTVLAMLATAAHGEAANRLDEFRIKRGGPFEFAQKPQVTRDGDRVTITFETKGFCDVTAAIENDQGKIVRHLASGVLGPNAPEPFQKNSKKQVIVWDGKDDQGVYIDDKDRLTVRVSLGLKPRFERTLLWSPHMRVGVDAPLVCAQPEGVYVFQGSGFDHLRLMDHEGRYVRTIYPFPAGKVDEVKDLKRQTFPQSGKALPWKGGFYETTLLTSGFSGLWGTYTESRRAGSLAMAVQSSRIALPCFRLNRLAVDGSSGGMAFEGPQTAVAVAGKTSSPIKDVPPRSAALSPDGKTLYLTGFLWRRASHITSAGYRLDSEWIHGVARMDYSGDGPPEAFVGSLKEGRTFAGSDNAHFDGPTSVDCDPDGRVYVADHFNDRIQVFSPDGTHLKTIAVSRPSDVAVDQETGHIYVFSWSLPGREHRFGERNLPATLTHFGPFADPRRIAAYPLPMRDRYTGKIDARANLHYRGAVDSWRRGESGPTIWFVPGSWRGGRGPTTSWSRCGILLLQEKDGKLVEVGDFGRLAERERPLPGPATYWRQRLYVRPTTGRLYVGQGHFFDQLIEIDPATGTQRLVALPFAAEDMAFDLSGRAYLRTRTDLVRYDFDTWREVPFDYGTERPASALGGGKDSRPIVSAISWPYDGLHHQGGMWVSPNGQIVVAHLLSTQAQDRRAGSGASFGGLERWTPVLFPGRGGNTAVQVWDEHGRIVYEDAVPGIGFLDGVAMDKDDNLYLASACTRVFGGKRYFDYMTGTLLKIRPKEAKVLTTSGRAPARLQKRPDRPPDLADGSVGGEVWVDAEWFYGGVGFTGKDGSHAMGGCNCWNYRFGLDDFARSFAPETQHYSVAVLDTNGNLILRVGRYGNVDDGAPLIEKGGPAHPRSIGGDEVSLFHPAFVATHTDHRLFIADPGNGRILSVKLNYHVTERMALKDVTDHGK